MTGGGQKIGDTDVSYGFILYCSTPPPGDPNDLEVTFLYQGKVVAFKLTALRSVTGDKVGEPTPPDADFNHMTGTGTGTLTGPGVPPDCNVATITFELIDSGEPGRNDQASFHIECDGDGTVLLNVPLGVVDRGNIQAHDATGIAARECV